MSDDNTQDRKAERSLLEVADSVTGFEELEVTGLFERPLAVLQDIDSAMWARALAFVLKRRAQVVDVDAYQQVLAMTIKDVWNTFADESVESGKDETPSEPLPESSELSAS